MYHYSSENFAAQLKKVDRPILIFNLIKLCKEFLAQSTVGYSIITPLQEKNRNLGRR